MSNNNYYDDTSVLELNDSDFDGNKIINNKILVHRKLISHHSYSPKCDNNIPNHRRYIVLQSFSGR